MARHSSEKLSLGIFLTVASQLALQAFQVYVRRQQGPTQGRGPGGGAQGIPVAWYGIDGYLCNFDGLLCDTVKYTIPLPVLVLALRVVLHGRPSKKENVMIGCLMARYLSSCIVPQLAQRDALLSRPVLALAMDGPSTACLCVFFVMQH